MLCRAGSCGPECVEWRGRRGPLMLLTWTDNLAVLWGVGAVGGRCCGRDGAGRCSLRRSSRRRGTPTPSRYPASESSYQSESGALKVSRIRVIVSIRVRRPQGVPRPVPRPSRPRRQAQVAQSLTSAREARRLAAVSWRAASAAAACPRTDPARPRHSGVVKRHSCAVTHPAQLCGQGPRDTACHLAWAAEASCCKQAACLRNPEGGLLNPEASGIGFLLQAGGLLNPEASGLGFLLQAGGLLNPEGGLLQEP